MRNSTLFLVGIAFLTAMAALTSAASAECASCMKEGDWSQSANAFLEGKPISDEPVEFGPKVVRRTTSQFEKETAKEEIILESINATPALPISASPVKITAVFALNGSEQADNQAEILLTATVSIKDSTGNEVEKLNLIKASANEYSNDWVASVPAGIYSVDIAASSLQGSASFIDVLQIEVVDAANNAEVIPATENLGQD